MLCFIIISTITNNIITTDTNSNWGLWWHSQQILFHGAFQSTQTQGIDTDLHNIREAMLLLYLQML